MAKLETRLTNEYVDKFYAEMKEIYPHFSTNDREHMLIVSAITLSVREQNNNSKE